jgi:hypothetical protein
MHYPIIGSDYVLYPTDEATHNPDNPAAGLGLSTISATTLQRMPLDNGVTVTYRVQDDAGDDLAGDTWPQTATFVAGSQGKVVVLLRDSLVFTPHVECTCVITADYGVDAHRTWKERLHPLPADDAP